jgi:hypothetical protein
VLAALCWLVVSGCELALSPGAPAIFELESVNGGSLPYTVARGRDQLGDFSYQVASATITLIAAGEGTELESTGQFEYAYALQESRGARTSVTTTTESGHYSIASGTTLTLTYQDGSTDVGSLAQAGGAITFVTRTTGQPQLIYAFQRQGVGG